MTTLVTAPLLFFFLARPPSTHSFLQVFFLAVSQKLPSVLFVLFQACHAKMGDQHAFGFRHARALLHAPAWKPAGDLSERARHLQTCAHLSVPPAPVAACKNDLTF